MMCTGLANLPFQSAGFDQSSNERLVSQIFSLNFKPSTGTNYNNKKKQLVN